MSVIPGIQSFGKGIVMAEVTTMYILRRSANKSDVVQRMHVNSRLQARTLQDQDFRCNALIALISMHIRCKVRATPTPMHVG